MPHPRTVAIAVASLVFALAFGFAVSGGYLSRAAIGLDPSGFPFGAVMQAIGEALPLGVNRAWK